MKSFDAMWLVAVTCLVSACTHIGVDDCPEESGPLGKDVPRIRSSNYRLELGSPPHAAARLLPYSLMSAFAYYDEASCPTDERKVSEAGAIVERLREPPVAVAAKFDRRKDLEALGGCEDSFGMLYHVWASKDGSEYVIAFRGTSNTLDWWYGNLWPVSRFFSKENTQYAQALKHARIVLDKIAASAPSDPKPKIIVTGHSLGGGLAQHVLYAYPAEVRQAIVFDPSIITGYVSIKGAERVAQCCQTDLGAEAAILRVYESGEILSNLRIFHKTFFPPHLHIQEVRLAYDNGWNPVAAHSMASLANSLYTTAATASGPSDEWYASKEAKCTAKFKEAHVASCERASAAAVCQVQ